MGMDCEVSDVTAVKIGHKIEVDHTDVKCHGLDSTFLVN